MQIKDDFLSSSYDRLFQWNLGGDLEFDPG
jgi:hypothetical protein